MSSKFSEPSIIVISPSLVESVAETFVAVAFPMFLILTSMSISSPGSAFPSLSPAPCPFKSSKMFWS